MTRVAFVCALLFASLSPAHASAAGPLQRFALVIGANAGGADRPRLQYAIADAERFARVLSDIGGVPAGNELLLRQPRLRDLLDALDTLTRRVSDARRLAGAAGGRTEVVLYYSGHADEQVDEVHQPCHVQVVGAKAPGAAAVEGVLQSVDETGDPALM